MESTLFSKCNQLSNQNTVELPIFDYIEMNNLLSTDNSWNSITNKVIQKLVLEENVDKWRDVSQNETY